MALTKTQVSQLYVSIFGRASEGAGNSYWQKASTSLSMNVTADIMLGTDAAKTYFGSSLNTNQAFIEYVYLNTLGKTYVQDTTGVDFWVNELDGGKTKGKVVATLIAAAQDPLNSGAAQDQFNNRVAVSNYTADNILDYTDRSTFSGFIDDVTGDDATVILAKTAIDDQSDAKENTYTITLTKGKDTILGSIGDDQILGLDDTYNVNDTIDGGNGIDTLSLLFFAPETEVVALIHVENVVVRNAHASTKVEAGNWTGVDLLTFSSSTAATVVTQVREKLNIEVDGNNQNVSLTYADDILGSLDNTQQLWVNNSTAGVDIKTGGSDKITFLDILASGTSVISLAENDLETITISGNGDLQLLSSAPDNEQLIRVSSILASSVTGDLTLDMSAIDLTLTADYFVTIVTGSGNDIIWASNNDNRVNAGAGDDRVIIHSGLDEMDLLEGGTGTDVLSMTSADFVATASLDAVLSGITGFEFIAISDELDSDTAMDVSVYGVNSIVIEAGLAGNQTLTGFSNEATIEIQTDASETDVLTITMLGATNSGSNLDNLNIVFNTDLEAADDIYAAAFDVKGINLISVTTADSTITGETTAAGTLPDRSDGYELVLSNEGNLSTISVRGDHAFRFASSLTSRVETILAESMNGNMILDFNTEFGGTQGINITSGNGNDTITGSVYRDLIIAGAGNDVINLTLGTDQVTGGAGVDIFVIKESGVSIDTAYSSILDFSAVSDAAIADKITNVATTNTSDAAGVDVSGAEASGGASMVITADIADGIISLSGADAAQINTFDEWLALFYLVCENNKTAGFEFNGNTYIVEESSTGGTVGSLVELTGVVSITALAATAGVNTVILSEIG